jgi:SAM-dependent methyltransferase
MVHKFSFLENILLRFNIIPHPIIDTLTNVVAGRALQIGMEIGVFTALDESPLTLSELVKRTDSSEEGIRSLVSCLEALCYLEKSKNEKYFLTKRGRKFFSKGSESYMANTTLFSSYVFDTLNNLNENVKAGGPKNVNLDLFTKEQWGVFNKAMLEVARTNASEVARLIPFSPAHRKLLDVGGSHGLYAIECCRKASRLTAEIIDLEPVKEFANQVIKESGMSKKVRFRVADFLKDDIDKGQDIILAFNIIHGIKPETNQKLTDKMFDSLKPGGVYVILDQIKEAKGKSDLSRLVSSAQGLMLFNVAGGRTYSKDDIGVWLKKSGFSSYQMKKLRAPGNAIIIGYK